APPASPPPRWPLRRGCAPPTPARLRMPPEDDQARRRQSMVDAQLRGRDIVDERVLRAMAAVPRERFVAEREQRRAYEDVALPIRGGQTISQPYMVARICEALRLTGTERVLR